MFILHIHSLAHMLLTIFPFALPCCHITPTSITHCLTTSLSNSYLLQYFAKLTSQTIYLHHAHLHSATSSTKTSQCHFLSLLQHFMSSQCQNLLCHFFLPSYNSTVQTLLLTTPTANQPQHKPHINHYILPPQSHSAISHNTEPHQNHHSSISYHQYKTRKYH